MKPWALIAHKDGYWAGVCSPELPKRELNKFLGDFVAGGFGIMTVYSREEYNQQLAVLKFWHDSPEWKMKHEKPANELAL